MILFSTWPEPWVAPEAFSARRVDASRTALALKTTIPTDRENPCAMPRSRLPIGRRDTNTNSGLRSSSQTHTILLTLPFVRLPLIIAMGRDSNKRRNARFAAILLAILTAAIAGCGSGSPSGTEGQAPTNGSREEFIKPGNKANKYAEFGHEATVKDREAASKVLAENLEARAAGNWATQCSSLTLDLVRELEGTVSAQKPNECASRLKQLAEPLSGSASVRADPLRGSIDVLMVNGAKAYALFHGTKNKDYAIPMEKAGGEWKVGALLTSEAP